MHQHQIGDLAGGRDQVFGEGAGQKAAVVPVAELFVEGGADRGRPGAADLPFRQTGVEDGAAVVGGGVLVDPHHPRLRVDLDPAEIEAESVGQGSVDLVVGGGRPQLGSAPRGGFAKARVHPLGQARGRPVGQAADPVEGRRVVGIPARGDLAVLEAQVPGGHVEQGGGDARHLVPDLLRRQERGVRASRREPAGIVAGGDRPAVLRRIRIQRDRDVVRVQAEPVRHHLGQHGLVALALGHRIPDHGDPAHGVHRDRHRGHGAAPGAVPLPLPAGLDQGDVAHVGLAGLDAGGVADAVEPAGPASLLPAALQAVQVAAGKGLVDDPVVVAGIEQGAGHGPVGKPIGTDQVLPDHVQRIHPQGGGDRLHHALHREVELGAAEAPHRARGAFVGEHHVVGDLQVADVVAVGGQAVHPVQRRRHRRAQVGAVVVPVGQPQRGHPAFAGMGGLDPGDAVRRGAGGGEMLQSVLDPLDRPPGSARQDAEHHDPGKDGHLGAEAPAGVLRAAKAQAVGAHAQRPRHDRLQRKGPLEVRQHVEAAGLRDGPRHHRVGLHGGDGAARIDDGQLRHVVGLGEGLVREAVDEVARGDAVRSGLRMQQRRIGRRRLHRIDHGRERPVLDLDRVQGVFGKVAVGGGDHRHRLADVADPADRHAVVVDVAPEPRDHGVGLARHVLAGHDRVHAGDPQCLRAIDRHDPGVGMGRAEKGGVQRPRPGGEVVDEPALADQQGAVLGAQHAAADVPGAGRYPFRQRESRHRAAPVHRGGSMAALWVRLHHRISRGWRGGHDTGGTTMRKTMAMIAAKGHR